jgi:sugar diacid utilization regulator
MDASTPPRVDVPPINTRSTAAPRLQDQVVARENAALRTLVTLYRHLSNLAIQPAGIAGVVELIADRVDTAVAVVDDKLAVLAAAEAAGSAADAARFFLDRLAHPRLVQVLEVVGPTRRALRIPGVAGTAPIIVAPILVGDSVPAYLLTLDDERGDGEDLRLLISEHAATVCGVILGRERVVAASATQVRYDLVEGLLSGKGSDPDEVRRWAGHLGFEEGREHRVLSIVVGSTHTPTELTRRMSGVVERFFMTQVPQAITAVRGTEVAVVLPEAEPVSLRASRLASACIVKVSETFSANAVTVGIGRVCRSALEIARSYDDARRTVDIAVRLGRVGTVAAVEDMGIHQLLLQIADPAQLREFAREVFSGLLFPAKGNTEEYLLTLACYFRENNSPQRASRQLHVHPNTVTYRVRRVEELTALDFSNYRDRLLAQVALEILDGVGGVR